MKKKRGPNSKEMDGKQADGKGGGSVKKDCTSPHNGVRTDPGKQKRCKKKKRNLTEEMADGSSLRP